MIGILSKRMVCCWLDNDVITKEQVRAYTYGCELLVSDMISNVIVLLAALLMGKVIEMIIFLAVFTSIRVVCGGHHASSYRNCILTFTSRTITLFTMTDWIVAREMYAFLILLLIVADIILLIFAPVDHPNRPLAEEEKIKFRKKTIIRVVIINATMLLACAIFPFLADKMVYALVAICDTAISFIVGLGEKYLQSIKKAI